MPLNSGSGGRDLFAAELRLERMRNDRLRHVMRVTAGTCIRGMVAIFRRSAARLGFRREKTTAAAESDTDRGDSAQAGQTGEL